MGAMTIPPENEHRWQELNQLLLAASDAAVSSRTLVCLSTASISAGTSTGTAVTLHCTITGILFRTCATISA